MGVKKRVPYFIHSYNAEELAFADNLVNKISEKYGIEVKDIRGTRSFKDHVLARDIFYYTLKKKSDFSQNKIGQGLNPIPSHNVSKKYYTLEQMEKAHIVNSQTLTTTFKKIEFYMTQGINKTSPEYMRKTSKIVSELLDELVTLESSKRSPKIGSNCVVNSLTGIITKIDNQHYRVLFKDGIEEVLPKHLIKNFF